MRDGQEVSIDRSDLLSHFFGKPADLPRDEPEIAANIHEQLQHMGLVSWPISVIRRVRDGVSKVSPQTVLEVGGGIGHRSAWLLDLFESQSKPKRYDIVEQGNKFAVIIKRLIDRYEASNWTNIKVGELPTLAAETMAWKAATITGLDSGDAPLSTSYDVIIVDEPTENLAKNIESSLPLLTQNGVLVTTEPMVPTGDVDEDDESKMATVSGFNNWIELIKTAQQQYYIAFIPVFEGTIVTFLKK
tara:strand:+ start:645 stop:1379 length:735 start_codon:yes stop_codon:yes gene_type:complete